MPLRRDTVRVPLLDVFSFNLDHSGAGLASAPYPLAFNLDFPDRRHKIRLRWQPVNRIGDGKNRLAVKLREHRGYRHDIGFRISRVALAIAAEQEPRPLQRFFRLNFLLRRFHS